MFRIYVEVPRAKLCLLIVRFVKQIFFMKNFLNYSFRECDGEATGWQNLRFCVAVAMVLAQKSAICTTIIVVHVKLDCKCTTLDAMLNAPLQFLQCDIRG